MLVHELLELVEAHDVGLLLFAEVLGKLLHSMVGQVHEAVVRVVRVQLELVGAQPQVALLAEVDVALVVEEDPDADVELALAEQQWPLDVLLDDELPMLVGRAALVLRLLSLLDLQLSDSRLLLGAHHKARHKRVRALLGFRALVRQVSLATNGYRPLLSHRSIGRC